MLFKTGKKKLIQENEFIDLNNDRLDLNASIVPYPHSIYPIMGSQSSSHNSSSSSSSSSTCDIVASYEDFHLCIDVYKAFLHINDYTKSNSATTAVAAAIPLSIRVASKYDPTTKFHVYEVPKPGKKMNNIFSFNNFRNNSSSNNNPDNNHNSDENDTEKNYRIYGYSDFHFGFINNNNTTIRNII